MAEENVGSPSSSSLKRKRRISDLSSFAEGSTSPSGRQRLLNESTPSPADIVVMATSDDLQEFISHALQLLEASAGDEFFEHLSLAVDQVIHPVSLLTPEQLADALADILPYNPKLPTQILDIINQNWADQLPELRAPLVLLLQTLIKTNLVSIDLAIELVDRDILQDTAVIANSQILATRTVRINTGLLYKQQKFNLLREENEGYAKLSHEFNVALSELPKSGFIDASDIVVKSDELLTVVNALIGYFELDPNRVLDNILDICSQNLLSHARFILYFLLHSPWAPHSLAMDSPFSSVDQTEKRRRLDSIQHDFSRHFREAMSKQGGSILTAQLLGFKLRFFSSIAGTRERSHASPESLIFLTALLIKSGFVKLSDLYPYLNPPDNVINDEYRKWKEEMEDKAFMAKSNPLALAGALGDDEGSEAQKPQASESNESKVLDPPKIIETNQKVSLLHALLAVGCLPAALQLLSLHPQISGPHSSISDGIHRLLHISIDSIYGPYSPSRLFEKRILDGLDTQKKRAAATRTSTGNVEWLEDLERKSVRGYSPFPTQEFGDRKIRFFLDDDFWSDDIPICQTMDDFYAFAINLLRFSGPRLGNDVSLLVKLARIGKGQFLQEEISPLLVRRWVDIARLCLIPAISLVGANPGVVNEIYELIRYFPFATRFSLYGEWQTIAYKTHPELKLKASETDKDTKGILRRISKQDVKRFGRALAKKSTSNPLILWAIAINQIENYDNFVEVVVDAAKFCTNLGYDVLEYVILSSLANPFKNRVKEDGTSIALWLTGLSAFCAKVFRRYTQMDVSTVTIYVAKQLKVSNIYDLIVLRDLVTQMGGILVRENLSDHQLRCYAGGESLKEQAMSLLREPGALVGLKKTSARLLNALMDADLAGLLVILIAQERGISLFNLKIEHNSNLKLLGNLFDECHGVLLQFHDFIVSNLDLPSFERLLPCFERMVKEYGIEPPVAFNLWRPILAEKIRKYDVELSIQLQKKKLLQSLAAHEKADDAPEYSSEPSPTTDNVMQDVSQPAPLLTTTDDAIGLIEEQNGISPASEPDEPWHPALRDFIEEASHVVAREVWTYMSPHFYTTFWQLNLYDIAVPMETYTQEVSKLTFEIKKKDADRTDMTPVAVQRRRRERERLQALVDQLNQEFKIQTTVYKTTKKRLAKEKEFWFDWAKFPSAPETTPPRNRTVLAILQHCIIPRCLFGPNEAIFSAKFVREMHRLGTKNFSSLTLFDKIFVNVSETVIFTCTNREAENYGRFLREVLVELTRWYVDKSVYEKEAIGPSIPGFLKKWSILPSEAIYLQYDEYRAVMFKWHKNLTTAFKNCLESRDYMHVRNALAVLEKIIGQYPQVDFHGSSLEEKVGLIAGKEESRGDLQVRAQGYLALLRKSSKSWVTAAKFSTQARTSGSPAYSPNPKRPSTPQSSSLASATTPNIVSDRQQPLRSQSSLNPNAPSFNPHDGTHRKPDEKAFTDSDGSIGRSRRNLGAAMPESNVASKSSGGEAKRQESSRQSPRTDESPSTSNQIPKEHINVLPDERDRPRSETGERRSRTSRSDDHDQRKIETPKAERSSRPRDESTPTTVDQSANRPIESQPNPDSRTERSVRPRDDSQNNVNVTGQQLARMPLASSSQPRDIAGNRPKTPDGPRSNLESSQAPQLGSRATNHRDIHQTRQLRYDPNRPMNTGNMRAAPGFRAPPPTGPRASALSGMGANTQGPNALRPPHIGRTVGMNDPIRGTSTLASKPSPPSNERAEQSTLSSAPPSVSMNPERSSMLRHASRDEQSETSKVQRPSTTVEPRLSRSHTTESELSSSVPQRDPILTTETPRGPSDWRGRPKRDLQDDDPRRLSRGPDSWVDRGEELDRPAHSAEENPRIASSKQPESTKQASVKARTTREKDSKDSSDGLRNSRETRQDREKSDVTDGRRTRTPVSSDVADHESGSRTRGLSSADNQQERTRTSTVSESKSVTRNAQQTKESGTRQQKENLPVERRSGHREKMDVTSREQKDLASKEQKSASHRDEEIRRRDDRDTTSRSRREEPRESRHDRPREGHHARVSSRRSPSRTRSDRGDKERDRENDRRNGSRRESRDMDHREKERLPRESDHRREAHERERSSRDRDSESRRGSRKHERDKSADALDRGTRSGDPGESPRGGDSALPNKRRRVVR